VTNTQAVTFVAWLTELLSERRQLAKLLQSRQRAKLIADLETVRAVEDRIRELVLDGLNLSKGDSPNPFVLVDAIAALPSKFTLLTSAQSIESYEPTFASLVPGLTIRLIPAIKGRMLELCDTLDNVITRKRQIDSLADIESAAAIEPAEVEAPVKPTKPATKPKRKEAA
jgi:hypothetical protein